MENINLKDLIAQNKTKEEIYLYLLQQGWKVKHIEEAYKRYEREEVLKPVQDDMQKKTITIIVTVGAILIGAGVFSFVASNWQYMGKSAKVAILIVSMLLSYTASWLVNEKLHYKKTAGALTLLGAIIYGASIFLIAQIFHIRANWPDGFILWMFGILALAYALDSAMLYLFAIPVGIAGFIAHPFFIFDAFGGHDPFLLTSSFLLLIATIVTFLAAFMFQKRDKEEKKFY